MIPQGQPARHRTYVPPQMGRRDLALEAGYDPNPDDLLPPAAHLTRYTGQEFAELINSSPYGCNDCNGPVLEDDMAPSCGNHYLCVPCYMTGDFRCRECRRVWDEDVQGRADDLAHEIARDERNEWRDNRPEGLSA